MKQTIQMQNISFSFGTHHLFDALSCVLTANTKNVLLGNNGSGKSTLFDLLLKQHDYDGMVVMQGLTYTMKQSRLVAVEPMTVYKYLEQYCLPGEEYKVYVVAEERLSGIDGTSTVDQLSGGQQQKLKLAVLDLQERDIVLMDEPTNHLDSETVDQLTQWIQQTKATVRVISHDRYRINQRAEYCYFLDQQQIKKYTGNYDDFVRRREEELEKQEQEHHDRIKKKKSEEKLIQTIRQRATVHKSPKWGKLLRHRMKVYQRNIIDHEKTRPTQESQVSYTMHGGQHKKKRVIEWSQLLIIEKGGRHISLMPCAISAQDRIVITGPNGSGKTSFLNTLYDLLGQRKTEESVVVGNNITVVYLDQHNKGLDQNMIIAQWFRLYRGQVHDHQIVATLLNHGLTHRHLSQKLSVLSHGQRIRLQLLAVTQMKPDVVILDEPTNHCDIATREAIEDMLLAYQGCVVCVSHDRYFTERIGCMRCLSIENGYLVEI